MSDLGESGVLGPVTAKPLLNDDESGVLGEVAAPGMGEVLSGVLPRAGLSLIGAGAGMTRFGADFFGFDSLADNAAEVARNAAGAAAESMPAGANMVQQAISGGLESGITMVPGLLTGSLPVTMGSAVAQTFGPRYTELRDKDFSGGRAALVAGIDAVAEYAGELGPAKVLLAGPQGDTIKRMLARYFVRDLGGEEATLAMQSLNAKLNDNPDMTWNDYFQAAAETAIATPFAGGVQVGARMAQQAARGEFAQPAATPAAPGGELAATPAGTPATGPVESVVEPAPPIGPAPTQDAAPDPTPPSEVKPAPTQEPPPPTWDVRAGMDGNELFGAETPAGPLEVYYDGDAWRLDVVGPEGQRTTLAAHNNKMDAMLDAERMGLTTQLPQGWNWAGNLEFIAYAPNGPTGQVPPFKIIGKQGAWELIDFDGGVVGEHKGTLASAMPKFEQIVKNRPTPLVPKAPPNPVTQAVMGAAKPLTPSAPTAPKPTFLSMLQHTPDAMLQSGGFDPRLYTGAFSRGTTVTPKLLPDGTFQSSHFGRVSLDARDALNSLVGIVGFDVRNASLEDLSRIHASAVLDVITTQPELITQVSPEVSASFGGKLEELARHAELRKSRGVPMPGLYEGVYAYQKTSRGERDVPDFASTIFHASAGPKTAVSAKDFHQQAPGVYIDAALPAEVRRYGVLMERVRKMFAPNARVLFADSPLQPAGDGQSRDTGPSSYVITLGGMFNSKNTLIDKGRVLQAALHEMGHVTIFEHYQNAGPQTKAELLLSWMKYTESVLVSKTIGQYLAEHHGDPRQVPLGLPIARSKNRNYFMSPSEYWADQCARHFMNSTSTGLTGMLRQWYDALMGHLEKMFILHNAGAFKKDEVFVNWLESLANREKKVGPQTGPEIGNGLGIKATDIKPAKNPITGTPQAEALIIRMTNMLDLLVQAGASKAEISALTVSNSVKDFPFEAARQLLVKYGVPPWRYRESYHVGDIDDTLPAREQIFRLSESSNKEFGLDKEQRHWLGESSSAIKAFGVVLQKTITAVQLRKRYGDQVPGVRMFVDTLEKMFAHRASIKEKADTRLKFMKEVSKADRNKVFEVMLEEDRSGEFLSTITQDIYGRRVFSLKPEALARFGLKGQGAVQAAKLYGDMRADFDEILTDMENEFQAELERTYSAGTPALLKAIQDLKAGFIEMKARPYVPHTRFGEHTLSVKDKDGKLVEFYQFESEKEARDLEWRVRKERGEGFSISRGKLTEQMRMMMGMPPQLANAMKAQLQLTPEQITVFEDTLKDMTHGASFVRRFKRRKNLAGWEDDAEQFPRAYADYMSRAANHLSRIKFNHVLTGSIGEVRKQAKDFQAVGQNTVEIDELGNWLARLQGYVNEPGVEYTMARAGATLWYLGFNVKSALVNATSVPFVSLPYLGKRYGDARAMAAVSQAYKDVARRFTRPQALAEDEQKFIAHLMHMGLLDQSFASELAGIREGGRLTDEMSLSAKAGLFYTARYYGMYAFQRVEVVNRQVTALAAYRLARTQRNFSENDPDGYDHAAMESAKAAVQDTQNENAQWNRAEFMRGRKGILTLFMSYQQNLLYQMMGGDPAWMRLLATQLIVAGLMGLPFAQDASDLIKWFSRKVFDKDFSPERAARQYITDFAGPKAEWLMKGMMHDVAGVNLQGSISQGRVIPGIEALAQEGKFAERFTNAAGDVGGAGVSIAMNIMKAIASNDPQHTKRAQALLPEAARALVEGGKMLNEGQATDYAGNKLTDVDPQHAVARMFGFQVANVSKERAKRFAQRDVANYWIARRQAVYNLFELAEDSGDSSWMEKAQVALREFNEEAPDYGLRINGKQLRGSLKSRRKADQRVEQNLGPSRSVQGLYEQVGRLYPTGE